MYAFRLKLGPQTFTNEETIYNGITFINGISTSVCSEREEQFFKNVGMEVIRVPVESQEFTDMRVQIENAVGEIARVKAQAEAYDARLVQGYERQIAVLEAAIQQTVNERDSLQKQLLLNVELIELRNLHFNGEAVVANVKNPKGARG